MQRPNVLVLFGDQHNARCLSCAGHPNVRTPNLDQIAERGIRFHRAYTCSPKCVPSAICFAAGVYASTHGHYAGSEGPTPLPFTSLFEHFSRNGYRTGAIGTLRMPRGWIEQYCSFFYDALDDVTAPASDGRRGNRPSLHLAETPEVATVRQTMRFLAETDPGTPWFAWVGFPSPEVRSTPSEPFGSMYRPESIVLPPAHRAEQLELGSAGKAIPERLLRTHLSRYLGFVSQVDYAVGLILSELSRHGFRENTITVYAADHGDSAGEHGVFGNESGVSRRAVTEIPLIVSVPGHPTSEIVTEAITESVDLFPTLCDLVPLPHLPTFQGRSFAGIVAGTHENSRPSALTEEPYRKAVATAEWRYVANRTEGEKDELYDLVQDPWETKNLLEAQAPEVAYRMLRLLLNRVVRARKPST